MPALPATITPVMARRIEIWLINRLVPYAKNARTHSAEQVAQIAASIVEFGFVNPIRVDTNNGIVAGHGRLLAARQLGLAEVPVVVLDHLSETQRRAYILADNRLAMNRGGGGTGRGGSRRDPRAPRHAGHPARRRVANRDAPADLWRLPGSGGGREVAGQRAGGGRNHVAAVRHAARVRS